MPVLWIDPFKYGIPLPPGPMLFVFNGESNASGHADNAEATTAERAARSSVQILNNTTLQFQSLDLDTNNNIGGNDPPDNSTHGLEVSLANMVEANRFVDSQVYLVKTGIAGSRIGQWGVGSQNWNTALTRLNAALTLLSGYSYNKVIWFSLGINDATDNTDPSTWRTLVEAHFAKMRALLGASTPIYCTRLPLNAFGNDDIDLYNAQLDAIALADPLVKIVPTAGAGMRDSAHWNAAGFRTIGESIGDAMFASEAAPVTADVPAGTYVSTQSVSLSTTEVGGSIHYTTSGADPLSSDPVFSTPISVPVSTTITARAFKSGKKRGPSASFSYLIESGLKWSQTNKSANLTLSNGDSEVASTGGTNFNPVSGTVGYSSGKRYVELQLSAYLGSNPNYIILGVGILSPGGYAGTTWPGSWANSFGLQGSGSVLRGSGVVAGSTWTGVANTLNDIIGFAVDFDAGKIFVSKNGDFGFGGSTQNPVTGANPVATFTVPKTMYPATALFANNPGNKVKVRSGGGLAYSVPSGYLSW